MSSVHEDLYIVESISRATADGGIRGERLEQGERLRTDPPMNSCDMSETSESKTSNVEIRVTCERPADLLDPFGVGIVKRDAHESLRDPVRVTRLQVSFRLCT